MYAKVYALLCFLCVGVIVCVWAVNQMMGFTAGQEISLKPGAAAEWSLYRHKHRLSHSTNTGKIEIPVFHQSGN